MSGNFANLLIETKGPVGWLTLNRPDALNALNIALLDELRSAWEVLARDDAVRVIVVTGAGRGFCTGVDVKELAESPEGMKVHAKKVADNDLGITSLHCGVWKPVICAINGVCAGGGLHFVADSDINIAASTATFLDPHVSRGQVSSWEPIGLIRRMPFDAVARMLFVGDQEEVSAQRALELGMISEVVDPADLAPAAQALGEKIAENSPSAMMVSKKILWESLDRGLGESLAHGARRLAAFWRHPDAMEGPAAYEEGREPRWEPPANDLRE